MSQTSWGLGLFQTSITQTCASSEYVQVRTVPNILGVRAVPNIMGAQVRAVPNILAVQVRPIPNILGIS